MAMCIKDMGLKVTRWRRYGKDRLYVETSDGTKVGWWDLPTGEAHPEAPECSATLSQAVEHWTASQTADATDLPDRGEQPVVTRAPASVVQAAPESDAAMDRDTGQAASPEPAEAARPWIDLADNEAGAEAREQALALRAAAPVRTTLARVLGVHTDERAWRIGADGEELVAIQLARAATKDPRWRFLHAIPVGDRGADIDHLVIGPGGIFTVNAKNHPRANIWVGGNTFMVNGIRQPYIRNSRHEAARATKLLTAACGFPVHVEGLIVTVNAADVVIKTQPDGVHVTWRNNLAKWLLRHGDIHPIGALDAVYDAARRSTTWQRR